MVHAKGVPMATMNISLPEAMKDWAEAQVETGRFANASDYVRDLIRRDQDRTGKITRLQALIGEGVASGHSGALDVEAFLAKKRKGNARKKA